MSDKIIAQSKWHWCEHCGNLWHASSAKPNGYCAASPDRKHSGGKPSGDYALFDKPDTAFNSTIMAQPDWRWCDKCNGLWHHTTIAGNGHCPAGGEHSSQGSGNYVLLNDSSGNI
ncbi:MAG: hypothetical protein MUO89_07925 [Dehalococcoidia bacterium]|nr:hypothetical protein [Dehalococcoidia bacterium]